MLLTAARVGLVGSASQRPFAPPAAALPRRRCLPLPQRVRAAAAISDDQQPGFSSELLRMAAVAGGKLTKTAVGRLAVAELRAECQRLGLPADGLKPALVERLMSWWEEQGRHSLQDRQLGGGSGADSAEQAAPAAGTAATDSSSQAQQVAQEVQAQQQPARQQQVPHAQQAQQQGSARIVPGGPVSVTWLGTSSGNPTPRRNVSSIAVQFGDDYILVDCGEGTHNQLRRTQQLSAANARAIFVTHMHGDHCFGVGGVLAAALEARRGTARQGEPLLLFGPPELQSLVLAAVRAGGIEMTTPVVVTGFVLDPQRVLPPTKVDDSGMLLFALQAPDQADRLPAQLAQSWQAAYDQGSEKIVQQGLTWSVRLPGGPLVVAAQLQHRVPCWGYVFHEPPAAVPPPPPADEDSNGAGAGAAAGGQGQQWVRRGRKLVILGDTCESSAIAPLALGCDLLSHEATFCSGMERKAAIAQHSTTLQAGAFAAAVDAQRLVLTHFSARYESVASGPTRKPRGSGGRARGGAEPEPSDLRRSDLDRLMDETFSTYKRDTLDLAHDFYTVEVPPPAPMPAEQLQELQARQAQQAAAAVEAAQAAARAHAAPQRHQRQGGEGYQQRRQAADGYQQRYQRHGGEGYPQRQQGGQGYQPRREGSDAYQQRRQGGEGYSQRREGGDGYQPRWEGGDGYRQRSGAGGSYRQERSGSGGNYRQQRSGGSGGSYQPRRQGGGGYEQRRSAGGQQGWHSGEE